MCLRALGFREAGSSRSQGFVRIPSRVLEPPDLQGLSVRLHGRAGHVSAAAAHCPAGSATHTHTRTSEV